MAEKFGPNIDKLKSSIIGKLEKIFLDNVKLLLQN